MWLPVMEISRPDCNGMMVARKSHLEHWNYIKNGSWDQHEDSLSGHLEFLKFWRRLGDQCDTLAPTLELGDVLVINKVKYYL